MQIFVKSLNGKTFILDVEPTETIYQIKKKIGIKEQIPAEEQRLNSSGLQLEDSTILSQSGIDLTEPSPTLQLLLRLRGGGHATFIFVNMLYPTNRRFDKQGPQWRYIMNGLNLFGTCFTKNCKAYQSQVVIQKGFGRFYMAKEIHKSPCPMCGKLCKNVRTMALHQARCKAVGLVEGETEERVIRFQQKKQHQFVLFMDNQEDMLTWKYLELKITKL